ncbi:hypothetical protein [Thermomonospora umbrina]|uniref:Endonuclease/exonuclease/phosphatase family protein n=1 Tax=Thermomonospora umbrina TaxID=111806 RepID=A0A3D9SXI7_9ACTN|nr:hypothetical protein [Thermomonospora umbrina]REF00673.1 hypothetical protein DFJ69_6230 [Thermomonospora umbrina]
MQLTVISQNISDGPDPERWPPLAARLLAEDPHVLLLQETGGRSRMEELVEHLPGWAAYLAPHDRPAGTAAGNVVAFDPNVFELLHLDESLSTSTLYGFAVVTVRAHGVDVPLSFCSVHFDPNSALAAGIEAQRVATRLYSGGGAGLLGGDVGHLPADPHWDDEPTWASLPHHRRGSWAAAGTRYDGDRTVAWRLEDKGLTDVVAHLARLRNDPALCRPTAVGGVRVDQMWATPAMAAAVVAYERLNSRVRKHSDHDGLKVTVDTDGLDRRQLREFV